MCSNHDDRNKEVSPLATQEVSSTQDHDQSRRRFIRDSAVVGAGLMFASSSPLFAAIGSARDTNRNIKSKGYLITHEAQLLSL